MSDFRSSPGEIATRFHVSGMDCASCVRKIETTARNTLGVLSAKVSLTAESMELVTSSIEARDEVARAVTALGYALHRKKMESGPSDDCAIDATEVADAVHRTSSYKRALWTVALLNVGFGIVELIGGFWSDSQALKADALDFLGDGGITLLGLLAATWTPVWRARTALWQGVFLGVLSVGILVGAAYRVFVVNEPQPEVMGLLGFIAFLINVGSVFLLMKHRNGDANVRAVWLFSRNDAIGNVGVIVAAGLVAWTGTRWPDLGVAIVVAALFLQSAWSIAKDARSELSQSPH